MSLLASILLALAAGAGSIALALAINRAYPDDAQ